ncbi:MAG: DUF494 family protein [Candidatus Kapabacteria bacterium]|nr:DUF494 family protein [Candidatus Kapabacteria bacterium]
MFERIIEILAYVISELRHNKNLNEIDVIELQDRGYTKSEISTAFSWLVDRIEFAEQLFLSLSTAENHSFRVFHPFEQDLFSKDAWGALIQYHSLGIITNEHIESIIDRGMMMGLRRIETSQLKALIGLLIFNNDSVGLRLGNKHLLDGNDTIN